MSAVEELHNTVFQFLFEKAFFSGSRIYLEMSINLELFYNHMKFNASRASYPFCYRTVLRNSPKGHLSKPHLGSHDLMALSWVDLQNQKKKPKVIREKA